MSELPDKFEAVDPVSGESFDLRVSYDCFRWHVKDTGHVLASYRASMIRALIQYGRDLERAGAVKEEPRCSGCGGAAHSEGVIMGVCLRSSGPRSDGRDDQ